MRSRHRSFNAGLTFDFLLAGRPIAALEPQVSSSLQMQRSSYPAAGCHRSSHPFRQIRIADAEVAVLRDQRVLITRELSVGCSAGMAQANFVEAKEWMVLPGASRLAVTRAATFCFLSPYGASGSM